MSTERKSDAERAVGVSSSLSTLQFKTIDGLKIRYATSEAATGHPILLSRHLARKHLHLSADMGRLRRAGPGRRRGFAWLRSL